MFSHLPTKIAAVLYLIFLFLLIVLFALHTSYWKTILYILLLSIPYTLISIYDIDCVFSGQCDVWGWVKSAFFIIYLLLTIVLVIFLLYDFQSIINTNSESEPVIVSSLSTTTNNQLVTITDKTRNSDPGGNGTLGNSDITKLYVATSNCVFNTSNQVWSGDCERRKN